MSNAPQINFSGNVEGKMVTGARSHDYQHGVSQLANTPSWTESSAPMPMSDFTKEVLEMSERTGDLAVLCAARVIAERRDRPRTAHALFERGGALDPELSPAGRRALYERALRDREEAVGSLSGRVATLMRAGLSYGEAIARAKAERR